MARYGTAPRKNAQGQWVTRRGRVLSAAGQRYWEKKLQSGQYDAYGHKLRQQIVPGVSVPYSPRYHVPRPGPLGLGDIVGGTGKAVAHGVEHRLESGANALLGASYGKGGGMGPGGSLARSQAARVAGAEGVAARRAGRALAQNTIGPSLTSVLSGGHASKLGLTADLAMLPLWAVGGAEARAGFAGLRDVARGRPLAEAVSHASAVRQAPKGYRVLRTEGGLHITIPKANSRFVGRPLEHLSDWLVQQPGPKQVLGGMEGRAGRAIKRQEQIARTIRGGGISGALKKLGKKLTPEMEYALRVKGEGLNPATRYQFHANRAEILQQAGDEAGAIRHSIHAYFAKEAQKYVRVGKDGVLEWTQNAPSALVQADKLLQQSGLQREQIYKQLGKLTDEQIVGRLSAPGRVYLGAKPQKYSKLIQSALNAHESTKQFDQLVEQTLPQNEWKSAKSFWRIQAQAAATRMSPKGSFEDYKAALQNYLDQFGAFKEFDQLDPRAKQLWYGVNDAISQAPHIAANVLSEGHALPKYLKDPARLAAAVQHVYRLAQEGAAYRDWYDRAAAEAQKVADAYGITPNQAAQLFAIFSNSADPTFAVSQTVKVLEQRAAGDALWAGRFPGRQSKEAESVFTKTGWNGRKRNSFYANIIEKIDPAEAKRLGFDKQPVTVDMWVVRMFDPYAKADTPGARYDAYERLITEMAHEIGWQPKELQAAAWVAAKKRGIIHSDIRRAAAKGMVTRPDMARVTQRAADAHEIGVAKYVTKEADGAGSVRGRRAGRPPVVRFTEVSRSRAGAKRFLAALRENPRGYSLTEPTQAALRRARVFLSEDGKAGYAIHPDGELAHVFRNPGGVPGSGQEAAIMAAHQGASWLNAFAFPKLLETYKNAGFEEIARIKFDPAQAPKGWTKELDSPDIVFMSFGAAQHPVQYVESWDAAEQLAKEAARPVTPRGKLAGEFHDATGQTQLVPPLLEQGSGGEAPGLADIGHLSTAPVGRPDVPVRATVWIPPHSRLTQRLLGTNKILLMFVKGNVTLGTVAHELSHVADELLLTPADRKSIQRWLETPEVQARFRGASYVKDESGNLVHGEMGTNMNRQAHEAFARGLEKYLMTGHAPPGLKSVFNDIGDNLRQWFRAGDHPDLSRDAIRVYDNLFQIRKFKGSTLVGAEDFNVGVNYIAYLRGQPLPFSRQAEEFGSYLRLRGGSSKGQPNLGSGRRPMGAGPRDPALHKAFTGYLIHSGYFTTQVLKGNEMALAKAVALDSAARARKIFLDGATDMPHAATDVPIWVDPTKIKKGQRAALVRRMLDIEAGAMEKIDMPELEAISEDDAFNMGEVLFPNKEDLGVDPQQYIQQVIDGVVKDPIPNVKWAPHDLVDESGFREAPKLGDAYGTGRKIGQAAGVTVDIVNDVQRMLLLYLNPAYIPMNLAGNLVMNLIQQGPLAPLNLWRAVTMHQELGIGERQLVDELMQGGLISTQKLRFAPQDYAAKLQHAIGMAVDLMPRRAAFLHEARAFGYKDLSAIKGLLAMARAGDETAMHDVTQITLKARDAIIDYDRLNSFEKNVVSRIIFFYPWLKGSTRYTMQMALNHPVVFAGMLMMLDYANIFAFDPNNNSLGNKPYYEYARVPLATDALGLKIPFTGYKVGLKQAVGSHSLTQGGLPLTLDIRQLITPLQTYELGQSAYEFATGHPNMPDFSGNIAPFPGALTTAVTGYDPFKRKEVPRDLKTFIDQFQGQPPTQFVKGLVSPQKPTSTSLLPRTPGEQRAKFFLGNTFTPTPYNPDVGRARASGSKASATLTHQQSLIADWKKVTGKDVTPKLKALLELQMQRSEALDRVHGTGIDYQKNALKADVALGIKLKKISAPRGNRLLKNALKLTDLNTLKQLRREIGNEWFGGSALTQLRSELNQAKSGG